MIAESCPAVVWTIRISASGLLKSCDLNDLYASCSAVSQWRSP